MTVKEWLQSDCDYSVGLEIYAKLPTCNRYFLKALQGKNTKQNLVKLKYELKKHLKSKLVVSSESLKENYQKKYKPNEKYYKKVFINQLPVDLHPLYIQQKSDFSLACSLKIQLNNLQVHEREYKALGFILKIDNLFTRIEKAWEIIDYYLAHKVVPKIVKTNFSDFSEMELLKKRISVRSSITRQKKRLETLTEKLKGSIVKKNITKYEIGIAKCEEKLLQLNQDLVQLNILISS